MVDWFYIGYCTVMAMFAVAFAYAAAFGLRALRRLPRSLLLGFAAAATVATLTAQKTNNVPPNMNQPQMQQGGGSFQTGFTRLTGFGEVGENSSSWRNENSTLQLQLETPTLNPVQTTSDDIARGWRVECAATNEDISYEMPSNGSLVGNWHVHGAASSFGNNVVDFGVVRTSGTLVPTNWAFPLGTNDEAFSSFWYFVDGRIRPTPRDAAHEICAVGVPMSAVPGQSRLWRLDGDDGSRVLTWENFFLGGDTNSPINAQIVLFPNGDFISRSNDVETVCRRINPDDWDDDGIHNERDANPTSYDGDFFGVANSLPPNANPDAYYLLDLSVAGVLGVATIRVTCDGASDLGDHVIIARTNQVCHIPLLAGATYTVDSNLPLDYSAVSTEYAEIVTNAENRLTVSLPLELSLVRILTRSAGSTGNYGAASSPINVYPSIVACLGGCCSREVVDGILQWSCSLTCTCGGGYHSFETTALWEGYSKLFVGYASCGCWEDAPDPVPTASPAPYAASVSANFSKDAVIFEDAYENMPGEWVSRLSTATMLTISASGGTNGAVLSVSATNLGKLQKNSGPAFPSQSVSVPARQSITYAMNYVGLTASESADDIEVVATLTDNVTGESITNDCQVTSVRLELAAVYEAPENPCTNRHIYGVGEKVRFLHYPESLPVTLIATKGDVGCDISYYDQFGGNIDEADKHRIYVCPIAASYTPNPTVSYAGVPYTPLISLVEPQAVITPEVSWESCHDSGDVGQSILITTNYISPMTVSFQGIMVAEIPCTETNTPTGYFATTNFTGFMTHSIDARAGLSRHIQERNRWTIDRAGGGLYRNWSAGQLTWNIPIGWGRLMSDRDTFGSMPVPEYEAHTNSTTRPLLIGGRTDLYTQTFQIDEDGTARIDKFGHWLSRGRYCRIILDGKTVQWTHPLW